MTEFDNLELRVDHIEKVLEAWVDSMRTMITAHQIHLPVEEPEEGNPLVNVSDFYKRDSLKEDG